MKHRLTGLLLALAMVVNLICVPVTAAAPNGSEGGWKYEVKSDGLCLSEYLGTEAVVSVPTALNGQKVTEIGSCCFRDNVVITEVEIPHGIRRIGEEAFYGCSELKSVHMSGSVNEISARAFAHTGLTSVVIPGSVRTVGDEAFLDCRNLYNIVIEEGVEELTSGEIGVNFGAGSVTLVEGIERIGESAFYDCVNLTRMRVPATVASIGSQALGYTEEGLLDEYQITGFAGSEAERYAGECGIEFQSLEPADGYSGVCGEEVCWSFVGGTLTISGSGRMYDYAAAECMPWYDLRSGITCAVVEEGVTSLGEYLFSGSAVSEVTLPTSLREVGKEAFGHCTELDEVSFTGDAPQFSDNAFLGTTLMARYPQGNATWTPEIRKDYGGRITWCSGASLPFADVPEQAFYYDAVAWAVEAGITTGTDSTHFSPDAKCQRATVVTFLWRAMGSAAPEGDEFPFADVSEDAFFRDAVQWAVEQSITSGTDSAHFSPYAYCNRAQVVTFLWRAMGCPEPENQQTPFADVEQGSWYGKAVAWAVEEGVTTGMSADQFGVLAVCNRAQIVTFLYRTLAD